MGVLCEAEALLLSFLKSHLSFQLRNLTSFDTTTEQNQVLSVCLFPLPLVPLFFVYCLPGSLSIPQTNWIGPFYSVIYLIFDDFVSFTILPRNSIGKPLFNSTLNECICDYFEIEWVTFVFRSDECIFSSILREFIANFVAALFLSLLLIIVWYIFNRTNLIG